MRNKIWAVMPAYNESKYIGYIIKKALNYAERVIVIDDCSKDRTYNIAEEFGADVFRNPVNMGAGFSTRVGCEIAYILGAEYIVTIDADGQHDPEDIPKLVSLLKEKNLDIVFGSRPRDKNMPIIKRIGNAGLSMIARILFGINIKDSQTGYHVFTKEAYPKLRWVSNRYGVVSEFVMRVAKARLKYGEAVVKTIYTDKKTGMTKTDALKSVFSMLKWRLKG